MNIPRCTYLCILIICGFPLAAGFAAATPATSSASIETIVAIRHGEKPRDSLGQLNCKGLNRSLALPHILLLRYGLPDFIFAPNPSVMSTSASGTYSYVRALATIEPTAIEAHLPVNTQIGLGDIEQLQSELTSKPYWNSVVFLAWEHTYLDRFVKALVSTYGRDPALVPSWPEDDYDSIFVIRLRRQNNKISVSFKHDYEGLNGRLSDSCPGPSTPEKHMQK
ncbi:MAG TPA: hypothetical protein VHX63_16105 [Acidobacteriaceae bacterium]|jgi:hypothetical protein|nr:hypothetical protein [Acidobacteriaceae bacterium]